MENYRSFVLEEKMTLISFLNSRQSPDSAKPQKNNPQPVNSFIANKRGREFFRHFTKILPL